MYRNRYRYHQCCRYKSGFFLEGHKGFGSDLKWRLDPDTCLSKLLIHAWFANYGIYWSLRCFWLTSGTRTRTCCWSSSMCWRCLWMVSCNSCISLLCLSRSSACSWRITWPRGLRATSHLLQYSLKWPTQKDFSHRMQPVATRFTPTPLLRSSDSW